MTEEKKEATKTEEVVLEAVLRAKVLSDKSAVVTHVEFRSSADASCDEVQSMLASSFQHLVDQQASGGEYRTEVFLSAYAYACAYTLVKLANEHKMTVTHALAQLVWDIMKRADIIAEAWKTGEYKALPTTPTGETVQ